MIELIQTLLTAGYTVTFEASGRGDFFCLLRRTATQELVHCCIGDTPEEALQGTAAERDASGAPGIASDGLWFRA